MIGLYFWKTSLSIVPLIKIPMEKSLVYTFYISIQGESIGAPHLVLVLQNLLWGHLTYTTSGGSAQHRDEGRLSIKKRSWRNALKPSASYSESWTPPELSQGPEGHPVGLNLLMFWNDYSPIKEFTKVLAHSNELARWTAIFFGRKICRQNTLVSFHVKLPFTRFLASVKVENMERLFKKEKGENMFRLTYDTERDMFELALTCWWSLHSLLTWCKRRQT
ncbi:hypothetical protein J3Q64DRAFT_1825391 [Phycomyces blakesleeanus]|uniref:Uncharacterized protein n=1 Tax=Phycomyces blakesleeanus TaxID=4837 RepID=A0ABR3ANJ2_PHYBL